MKDRLARYPGRYTAVVDTENIEKGTPFNIVLSRDDEPTVEGTPYNKDSVLPDELASLICPGIEDPTPADAFRGLLSSAIESKDYPGCYYRIVSGNVEWINPPTNLDTAYRTVERFMGEAVYVKIIDFGELPAANTERQVNKGLPGKRYLVRHSVISGSTNLVVDKHIDYLFITDGKTTLKQNYGDIAGMRALILCYYTQNTGYEG